MKRSYEFVIITALFLVICFIYKGQQRITLNNGQGWDGAYYYEIAEQIQQGEHPVIGELPFIKRIGTLFFIGTYSRISGTDLLDSALLINLIGTFITVILLMFWLRIFIDVFWIRGVLLLLFMTAWFVPLRSLFYEAIITDAWGSVWFLGGLLLLHCIRTSYNSGKNIGWYVLAFSFVVGVGILFRESNAVLALALLFLYNPLKHLTISSKTMTFHYGVKAIKRLWRLYAVKQSFIFFLPIIFIALFQIIVSNIIIPTSQNEYSYIKTVFNWFYTKSLTEYLLGICIAFGPLLLLLPFYYKHFKEIYHDRQELLFLLIISFIFGFIGGSDTERISFMSSFPIVFVLIGLSIKRLFYSTQRWWLYVLFALQTIAYRFYWTLPDYPSEINHLPIPFYTLMSNRFQYLYLYSHHGHYFLSSILFIEYLFLFMATFYVLHNKVTLKSFRFFYKQNSKTKID